VYLQVQDKKQSSSESQGRRIHKHKRERIVYVKGPDWSFRKNENSTKGVEANSLRQGKQQEGSYMKYGSGGEKIPLKISTNVRGTLGEWKGEISKTNPKRSNYY